MNNNTPQPSTPSQTGDSGRLCGCRVLVADPDASQQKLIGRILESEGARVRTVSDSAEVITILFANDDSDRDTDLVILNANLPSVGDVHAVRRLRDGGFRKPILAMAHQDVERGRADLLMAGYNDVIDKPISRESIVSRLQGFTKPPL